MANKGNSKRELIDTGRDKRFVRRDEKGQFDEVVDVGKSLAADRRQHSKKTDAARPGRSRRPKTPQQLTSPAARAARESGYAA